MNFFASFRSQYQEFSASPGKRLISLFFYQPCLGNEVKTSLRAAAYVAMYLLALQPVSFLVCVNFTFQEAYELLVFFIL